MLDRGCLESLTGSRPALASGLSRLKLGHYPAFELLAVVTKPTPDPTT
jgi:hypothetical protein